MATPRCGMPDIVNGTNYMQARDKKHNIHTVSHYSFFPENLRWPPTKTHLTYRFGPKFPANSKAAVARAFQKWDRATFFTFQQVGTNQASDLVITFNRRDHGDGAPFDGPGGVLAHATAPTTGRFHYDFDEKWSVRAVPGSFHLETIALHEIGHLLGLEHSTVRQAIMYPSFVAAEVKQLHRDDIQGIRVLYNR